MLRLLQESFRLTPLDGRKVLQKDVERVAALQVRYEVTYRDSRAREDEVAGMHVRVLRNDAAQFH
jgi:hypothetical protein